MTFTLCTGGPLEAFTTRTFDAADRSVARAEARAYLVEAEPDTLAVVYAGAGPSAVLVGAYLETTFGVEKVR